MGDKAAAFKPNEEICKSTWEAGKNVEMKAFMSVFAGGGSDGP